MARLNRAAPSRVVAERSCDAAEESEGVNRFVNGRSVVGLYKGRRREAVGKTCSQPKRRRRSHRRREAWAELSFVARRRGGPPNAERVNWG